MAWQTPISQNTQVSLGATDSVYIDTSVTIGVSGAIAILGGSVAHVIVDGTVLSGSDRTIFLNGTPSAATTEIVEIGATGKVTNYGTTVEAAIAFAGSRVQFFNAGLVHSEFEHGVRLNNSNAATQSTLTNTGTIEAALVGVARLDNFSIETIVLNNSGLISGGTASYGFMFAPSTGRDLITNTGRMVGDVVLAGGNDVYNGASGRLTGDVLAGDGTDTVTGGIDGNEFFGGPGDDTMRGGGGTDRLDGGSENDTFQIAASEGLGDSFAGGPGTDKIQVLGSSAVTLSGFKALGSQIEQWQGNSKGVLGTNAANQFDFSGLSSASGWTSVDGKAGNDTITGSKFADILIGGLGKDTMAGGLGLDRFDFNALAESVRGANRDAITDFNRGQGDKIDLFTIDADIDGTPGNQKFTFIGAAAFTGVDGQLRASGGVIQGDVNGDRIPDFEIKVNLATLIGTDFIL